MASLMVSSVPTYSFKRSKVPQPYVLPLLVFIGLMFAAFAGRPWMVLTLVAVLYLATFPFSIRSFHRLKEEAERLHDDTDDPPSDAGSSGEGDSELPSIRSV
jgi:CDP-diacylglycerol--serine O-phosphatidyltransferase